MKAKRNWLLCFIIFAIFLYPTVSSESLFPDLDEVYGIDVPSFISTAGRYPDSRVSTEAETIYTFSNVTDEEYYAYGTVLEKADCSVSDYSVQDSSIAVTISIKGKTFSFIYDSANSIMTVTYPEGVFDEVYHGMELQYQEALQEADNGYYDKAIKMLNKIPEYENTSWLIAKIKYFQGMKEKEKGKYSMAIKYFKEGKEYPETQAALSETYNLLYSDYIQNKKYEKATELSESAAEDNVLINQFVCFQPGDTGENVYAFFSLIKDIGFIKKLDSTYSDQYVNSIIEMENRLGLTADGVIYSDELIDIALTVYPGRKGNRVRMILEHLADAGYITGDLPFPLNTYESKYSSAVMKAKKTCGLIEDKIITTNEINTIMELPINKVEPVTNIKVISSESENSDGTAKITWKQSKNALFYEIQSSENGFITRVNRSTNSYTIKDCWGKNEFSVIARNYEHIAEAVKADPVWVGPVQISLSQLLAHKNEYINRNVEIIDYLKIYKTIRENGKLYVLVADKLNNVIYLWFKNDNHRFLEVRDNEWYWEGNWVSELIPHGKLNVKTRWDETYGDVDILNVEIVGLVGL